MGRGMQIARKGRDDGRVERRVPGARPVRKYLPFEKIQFYTSRILAGCGTKDRPWVPGPEGWGPKSAGQDGTREPI